MKTVQPVYDRIKESIDTSEVFIKVGKKTARIQRVYRNPRGTFVYSSLGEHKVDLFTELYIS